MAIKSKDAEHGFASGTDINGHNVKVLIGGKAGSHFQFVSEVAESQDMNVDLSDTQSPFKNALGTVNENDIDLNDAGSLATSADDDKIANMSELAESGHFG